MRPKAVTIYLPLVESVADDFIRRLKKVRVDKSKVIPNLRNEISKWNVKCKTYCIEVKSCTSLLSTADGRSFHTQ